MVRKKKPAAADWKRKRFAGMKVVLAGKTWFAREKAKAFLEAEGATIAKSVTADVDVLVLNHDANGSSTAEKKAAQLKSAGKASISELTIKQLEEFVRPDAEETLAMLQAGEKGVARLRWLTGGSEAFTYYCGFDHAWLDLTGAKLPGVKLANVDLTFAELDGADFRNAQLAEVSLRKSVGVRFDGATINDLVAPALTDCSFKKAHLVGTLDDGSYLNCDFSGATLASGEQRGWIFRSFTAPQCNFSRADLTGLDLEGASLDGSDLRGADLRGAGCRGASFKGCDLSKAKLAGANLAACDFTGAKLDGADFREASVRGAKFDEPAAMKAKNLNLDDTAAPGQVGPKLRELKTVVDQATRVESTLTVKSAGGEVEVGFSSHGPRYLYASPELILAAGSRQPGFTKMMVELASQQYGEPLFDTLKVKASRSPVKGKQLKELALAAWCEAFGVEPPSDEQLAEKAAQKKSGQAAKRAELVELLKSGPAGVKQWNAMDSPQTRAGGKYRGEDFSKAYLEGWETYGAEFEACDFSGAKLKGAHLYGRFNKCVFTGADLRNAELQHSRFGDADFSKAKFTGATLQSSFLRRADFSGANLKKCNLSSTDLRGANLSSVDLSTVDLEYAQYDDQTLLPESFVHRDEMQWKGPGHPPGLAEAIQAARPAGPIDLETFMERIKQRVEAGRLDKALKMLKADRFQLFADVQDDHLVGVVKSQSDPDLVYSSRLDATGMFACCTQNLNICGGLRGAPCKHLLVLIIGLAQSDRVDPTTVDEWLDASRLVSKPELDKDAMSETFLRYKGAEAGEVDWRPTETVPEDYYAF